MREICFGIVPHAWSIPQRGQVHCLWCGACRSESDKDVLQQTKEAEDLIRQEWERDAHAVSEPGEEARCAP